MAITSSDLGFLGKVANNPDLPYANRVIRFPRKYGALLVPYQTKVTLPKCGLSVFSCCCPNTINKGEIMPKLQYLTHNTDIDVCLEFD